jgi:hypothetical protein
MERISHAPPGCLVGNAQLYKWGIERSSQFRVKTQSLRRTWIEIAMGCIGHGTVGTPQILDPQIAAPVRLIPMGSEGVRRNGSDCRGAKCCRRS